MKRIVLCILSLLIVGAGVFLASSASATVNPETPPVTLPTCPGPTKTTQPHPGETTTTVKVELCVDVEFIPHTGTEKAAAPVLDEPLEVRDMAEVVSLLRWILIMNGLTLLVLVIRRR